MNASGAPDAERRGSPDVSTAAHVTASRDGAATADHARRKMEVRLRLTRAGFVFQDTDPEATFRWLVASVESPGPEIVRNRTPRRGRPGR